MENSQLWAAQSAVSKIDSLTLLLMNGSDMGDEIIEDTCQIILDLTNIVKGALASVSEVKA